ncbi:hypothetical protein IGB42_04167 [Andreprevotia sp. IGB-42]|nr:hypothetical protein IGB42_04167 [Andreprevotia sp. IGB-42]
MYRDGSYIKFYDEKLNEMYSSLQRIHRLSIYFFLSGLIVSALVWIFLFTVEA